GEVIDQTDPGVTWDGRAWKKAGRVFGVPSTHRLIGRPGSSHDGWYYDWNRRAWMKPDAPRPAPQPRPSPAPRPMPFRPQPTPQPPAPQPTPQPPAPKPPEKETDMNKNMLDALIKHPVAPVIGGLLLVASHLTDEPTPPP